MAIKVRVNPRYEWDEQARNKGISPREVEVIALLAQGYDNQEIAGILQIQYQSVKNHTYHLTEKLGAKNTTQALLIAIGENLIRVENPELDRMSGAKNRKTEKFWETLERLVGTEDTPLAKKIKKWMIRNGIDVDI